MLSGGLILLSAYVLVPVAIAWLIVRANVRTIAKAYGIWIGFLVVAFGLLSSTSFSEGIGWSLIIAMFYTTPVVPVLCLIMNIWSWSRARLAAA
ncbi:MAG: hypothetical protein B7Y80_07115 [Hyphomicrobium sp. 32-62-53]|nr:MAG: hypothetical protein B7Y80_07115 [Hyphomicrobium sp. 32-62-53]